MGLHRAGFNVIGVDIEPQPNYPFTFVQADALNPPFDLSLFNFIWASPPCQKYTSLHFLQGGTEYPDLIEPVRQMLVGAGPLWTIENVPGSPLHNPIVLCGSRFGLRVRRHRHFESRFLGNPGAFMFSGCNHKAQGRPIDISGTGSRRINARRDGGGGDSYKPLNLAEAQSAIGIDWMNREELAQAIPPAYAEFIGRAALQYIRSVT